MSTKIPPDVQAELDDPAFITRMHGRRSTHSAGCRGPLCILFIRTDQRERYAARRIQAGKKYEPDERVRIKDEREPLLRQIMVWHWRTVFERRMGL